MPQTGASECGAGLCFLLVGSWLGGSVWGPGRLFSAFRRFNQAELLETFRLPVTSGMAYVEAIVG